MNIQTALLVCFLGMQYYTSQVSDQSSELNEFDNEIVNHLVVQDTDTMETRMFACNPPFQVIGLYDPNVPLTPNTAIFADPLVKAEIMSDGFQGKDKEYGDIDNDGLIDILYTKNDNELWYIPNTGTLTVPDYQVSNAVQTAFINVFSFRLVDFFNDGILDLLLLEDHGVKQINLYSNIHTQLGAPASIGLLDDTTFPLRFDQLIEAGDVDGDGDTDVLISGQDPGLEGTAFLEQLQGPAPFFFPYLQLAANQTLPLSPMIPDNVGSYHTPEMYDADCDGDLDLFISDPLLLTAGGHVDYYENTGSGSPFLYFTQQSVNPYGLVDIPGNQLRCDWIITRFVDFFGDGCPEAIAYNLCNTSNSPNGEIFFYKNNCSCYAAFTYELTESCHIVQFYNQSQGSNLSYSWSFGESSSGQNNTSTLLNPLHQYSTCGTYNVCLTITGPDCSDILCHSLQLTDFIPPVALCKSGVVLTMGANCAAFIQASDIDNGSFDNCQLGSLNILPPVFSQCGFHNVTFTVTDWCGNTDVCNAVVEVVDIIPPTITCPEDVYLTSTDDVCKMVVNGIQWLSLSDNCGIPSVSYKVTGASNYIGIGDASGLTFNQGTSVVCYTATDICGNTATCSFNVVLDCPCVCPMNMIQNPGFSEGIIGPVIGGPLLGAGQTDYWLSNGANTNFPYVNTTKGCCDNASIEFGGTSMGSSSIYQTGLSFLNGHHYKISFCAERLLNNNFQYAFVAANAPIIPGFSPYNCSNCDFIGVNSVNPQSGWVNFSLPIWTPTQNWDVLFIRPFTFFTVGGIDNICVEEVFYVCCGDENAFIENADAATSIYAEQDTWEGVFEIGNLMECNLIDYIKWGDGAETDGPIGGNAMFLHEYSVAGTYQVEYKVREFDPQDSSQTACFEHIFIDDIVIFPDTCFCGEYSNMFIKWDGGQAQEVVCGGSPVPLGCPGTGAGYDFTGLFYCNGIICPDESNVTWILNGPGGSFSGSSMANPYFGVTILPSYVSLPGVYTLSLSGACGSNSCMCTIQFIVDCPVLCPCSIENIQALSSAVDMGFSQATQSSSCIACFSPNAISNCETVEWHIGSITPIPNGITNGNQTFCYNFPNSGSYTVIMVVNRKKPSGDNCETFTFTRQVNVNCQDGPQCNDSRIVNPNFNDEGSVPGGLNSGGSTSGWIGAEGNPVIMTGVQDSHDGWVIGLRGNHNYSDVLQSKESICFPPTGAITLRYSIAQTFPVRHGFVKVTLVSGSEFKTIGTFELPEIDSSNWWESEFPFDVTDWIGSELCDDNEASVPVYIQLSVYNEFGDNQGGPLTFSEILVDNVCIDNMVSSSSPILAQAIKLFPNPNGGEFAIEFPETVHQVTSLQIIDITGQVLIQDKVEVGATLQHIDAYNLPQGIYFLRVLLNEKIISFERFIKL